MKKLSLVSLACAAALAICPAALVGQTYDFTFSISGGDITGTGTLVGTLVSAGVYDVESGTISLTTGDVIGTGILELNTNAPICCTTYSTLPNSGGTHYIVDNLLTPGSNPALDSNGIVFLVGSSPATQEAINIWGNGTNDYTLFEGNYLDTPHGTFTITGQTLVGQPLVVQTPEGGAALLYLLLTGGTCFGAMFFSTRSGFGNHASA